MGGESANTHGVDGGNKIRTARTITYRETPSTYLVTLLGPELGVEVVLPTPAAVSPLTAAASVAVALVALLALGVLGGLGVLGVLGVLGALFFGAMSRVGRLF